MRGFAFPLRLLPALLLTIGLAIGLGGCLLGPDYVRPNVPTPANFRFEASEAVDAANTRWWEQFQDPVLNDLILKDIWNLFSLQGSRPFGIGIGSEQGEFQSLSG